MTSGAGAGAGAKGSASASASASSGSDSGADDRAGLKSSTLEQLTSQDSSATRDGDKASGSETEKLYILKPTTEFIAEKKLKSDDNDDKDVFTFSFDVKKGALSLISI
jgi:hypothetical protein